MSLPHSFSSILFFLPEADSFGIFFFNKSKSLVNLPEILLCSILNYGLTWWRLKLFENISLSPSFHEEFFVNIIFFLSFPFVLGILKFIVLGLSMKCLILLLIPKSGDSSLS